MCYSFLLLYIGQINDDDDDDDDEFVVVWRRVTAQFSCPMRLQSYPMDTQGCPLRIESCKISFLRFYVNFISPQN